MEGMPILNLRRDAGFLFHGVKSEPDRETLVKDLRHLFNDFDVPGEFNSAVDFQNAVASHQGGCLDSKNWQPSAILTARVQDFFRDVEDVVWMGERVFYDINMSAQRSASYDGADVLVSHSDDLFRMIYESYDWMLVDPESYMTIREAGLWSELGLSREVVSDLFAQGVGKNQIMTEAKWLLEFCEPEQMRIAIEHRYMDLVQGLREEDQIAVLKLALVDRDFFEIQRRALALYTQEPCLADEWCEAEMSRRARLEGKDVKMLSGELRRKFELHLAFARELAADFEHVSTGMILSKIMAESGGDRKKTSPAGYRGLMQLGGSVFEGRVDSDLPQDVRGDIFHYKANMSAGSNYLEWCFVHPNNQARYFAVASGNYNWGPGNMRDYLAGGKLPEETTRHIAKLLIFTRLFSEMGIE